MRAPEPWPAKRKPKLFCLPPPSCSLNQPKNAPLDPEVAVSANVPDTCSLSFSVLAGNLSAYQATFESRQIVPPISPCCFPAKFVPVKPNSCLTGLPSRGLIRFCQPSHNGSYQNAPPSRLTCQ